MIPINIVYLLNEEGQKEDILNGGKNYNGVKCVVVDATPELTKIAQIYRGIMYIGLYAEVSPVQVAENNEVMFGALLDNEGSSNLLEIEDENKQKVSFNVSPKIVVDVKNIELNEIAVMGEKLYSEPLSDELLQKELKKYVSFVNKLTRTSNRIEKDIQLEKEELNKSKLEWIKEHGSEQLKLSLELGYDNNDLYVKERAATEFPNYEIYQENNSPFGLKRVLYSSPSLAYLKELKTLKDKNIDVKIGSVIVENIEYEALIIEKYLGNNTLIKYEKGTVPEEV